MNRAIVIREKVTRLVKLMVEQRITVTQRGSTAYVQYDSKGYPSVVNIPYIPDDATEEFLNAIEGFLDHEVAHVLFSDFSALKKAKKHGVGNLHNIIEDAFIERMMADSFQGSGLNLTNVGNFFLKNYTDKQLAEKPTEAEGILMVPVIRALSGQTVFKDYMKDKWELVDGLVKKFKTFAETTLPHIKTSAEAVDAAIEIRKLIEGEVKESEDGEDGEGKGGKSKEKGKSKGEDSKGKGDASVSDSDDGEAPDDFDDDGTEGESGDDSSKGEKDSSDSDGEGDGGSEGEGEEGDDLPELSPSSKLKPTDSKGSSDPKDHTTKKSAFEELEDSMVDYDKALAELLSEKAGEETRSSDYIIYTKDFDKVEPLVVGERGRWDDSMLKSMQDKVDHMVGPLQKDLERAIAARSASVWSAGHRSGRLNPSALARLTAFKDDRAFRRKHESTTKDVAVSLLVDCSGSMSGRKIETAAFAAYGLSAVLDRIGIEHEILGFTTTTGMPSSAAEAKKVGVTYARSQALYIPIFKSFQERMGVECKKRLAALPDVYWLNENVDGESVQIAATRLMGRREKRKILIVLSDGNPACPGDYRSLHRHLKKTVKEVENRGIDVLGIGIESEAPKHFYSRYVLLDRISELPTTVIGEIKRLLMK